jgi:hypothetical protein
MNEQNITKIVTAHGLIWKNLTLYSVGDNSILGIMTDATPSYLSDRRISFPEGTPHDEALEALIKIDSDTDDRMSLYAEEG